MRISIKTKIIATFSTLILIAVAVLGTLSYIKAKDIIISQMKANCSKTVENANEFYMSQFLHNMENTINTWSASNEAQTIFSNKLSLKALQNSWSAIYKNNSNINSIYIGTKDGKMFCIPSLNFPKGYDPRRRIWYKDALDNMGDVIWTEPYLDSVTHLPTVTVAKTILNTHDGNTFIGVMAMDISLENFSEIIGNIKFGKGSYAMLVDPTGLILADKNKSFVGKNIKDMKNTTWAKKICSAKSGQEEINIDGSKKFLSFITIPKTGWRLAGIMPLDTDQIVDPIRNRTIYVGIISILIASLIGFFIARSILNSMGFVINEAGKKISSGDLSSEINVKSNNEIGDMAKNFNIMLESQKSVLKSVLNSAEDVGVLSENLRSTSKQISVSTISQFESFNQLTIAMTEMAKAIEEVTQSISEVAERSNNINLSVEELKNSSLEVKKDVENTSDNLENATSSLQQMDASIEEVANNSIDVSEKAKTTLGVAELGKATVENTICEMDNINETIKNASLVISNLGEAAKEIGDIVEVIDDIAEQTNLLSLNAAIEAARAGEHGKGFAVVAAAVGSLAEKSSEATKDIAKLIKGMQQSVENAINATRTGADKVGEGVKLVKNTGDAFEKIFEAIGETTTLINGISDSIQEQSKASKFMMNAIISINHLSSNVTSSVTKQDEMIENILNEVSAVSGLSQDVAGAAQEQAASSQEIVATTETVNGVASEISAEAEGIADTAEKLADESKGLLGIVAKFKLK